MLSPDSVQNGPQIAETSNSTNIAIVNLSDPVQRAVPFKIRGRRPSKEYKASGVMPTISE